MGFAEGIGCLVGVFLLIPMFYIDMLRWTPLKRSDRLSATTWGWMTAVLAMGLYAAQAAEPGLSHAQMGMAGAVVVLHALWGLHLLRDWRASIGISALFRVLATASSLSFLGWALYPAVDQGFGALAGILRLENLDSGQMLRLTGLITVAFALPHIPRWPERAAPKWVWNLIRASHNVAWAVSWGMLGLAGLAAIAQPLEWDWASGPKSWAGMHLLGEAGYGLLLYVGLAMVVGLAWIMGKEKPTQAIVDKLTIEALRKPYRPRLTLSERSGLLEIWEQPFPTTAVPYFVASVAILWAGGYHTSTPMLLVGAALMPLAILVAGFRSYDRKLPFEGTKIDLERMDDVAFIKGLRVQPGQGVLIKRDQWDGSSREDREGSPEDLLIDAKEILLDGQMWVQVPLERIERVALRPFLDEETQEELKQEAQQSNNTVESDDEDVSAGVRSVSDADLNDLASQKGEEEEEETPKASRTRLKAEIVLRDGTLTQKYEASLNQKDRISLAADAWFAALRLNLPLRMPHRQFPAPNTRAHGNLSQRIINDHRLFEPPEGHRDDTNYAGEGGWTRVKDENEDSWWMVTPEEPLLGGVWWVFLVVIAFSIESFYVLAAASFQPGMVELIAAAVRLALWPALVLQMWSMHLQKKHPNIYCVAIRSEGIIIQDKLWRWEELSDLNTLPSNELPLMIVAGRTLVSLPCPLGQDQRLAMAVEIGKALGANHQGASLLRPGQTPQL